MVRRRRVLRRGHHHELPARSRELAGRIERVATEPHELPWPHSRAAGLSKGAEPGRPVRVRSLSLGPMRAKRKTDYHHGRLRRALIETAVKTIALHGVDALSLRELAARAGGSPGAPYHHFPNRSELLASIAEEGFARLEAQLVAARDAAPDNASARLEALGLAYVTFAVSSLGYFRVMFHGGSTSSAPTAAGLRTFNILRAAVVACQQAGHAPSGDATGLVLVAWSTVHGFATLWVDRAL